MPAADPYCLDGMARTLNIGRAWVVSHLNPVFIPNDRGIYPAACLVDLTQQLRQFRKLPVIGRNYTETSAAEQLGCTRAYLLKLIEQHGLPGRQRYRTPTNRQVWGIPRPTVRQLQLLALPFAPHGMVTVAELRAETGWASDTIRGRLNKAGILPTRYRCYANGHAVNYYPLAEALLAIGRRLMFAPPGGDYMTASTMGDLLSRTWHWVEPRLQQPLLRHQAQLRLDDSGTVRYHYPRTVFLELKRQSEHQRLIESGLAS